MKYWLLKSEPSTWSWKDQKKAKTTMWDGVRNYQARNNLVSMKKNDKCFFYHSVLEKQIVGKQLYDFPTVDIERQDSIEDYRMEHFTLNNYNGHKNIKVLTTHFFGGVY